LVGFFYADEIQTFRENLEWIANAMLPFGEAEGFMRMFKGLTPEELKKFTDKEFMQAFFAGAVKEISIQKIREIVDSIQIEEIDHADYIANVRYSFINVVVDESHRLSSEINLILSEGEWYLLFRSHMTDNFAKIRQKIDLYYDTKKKDNISLSKTPDDELQVLIHYGFKTFDDETLIHPRFEAVGDFRGGLAPVKMFSLWGYINKKGDYVIQPKFHHGAEFFEGLAAVGMRDDDFDMYYGFINKKGKLIIDFVFNEVSDYSEGLVAVRQGYHWGYLDKRGKAVISFEYDSANDFSDGNALVEKDGSYFIIDFEGNIIQEADMDDLFGHGYDDDDDDDDDFF